MVLVKIEHLRPHGYQHMVCTTCREDLGLSRSRFSVVNAGNAGTIIVHLKCNQVADGQ